MSEVFVFQAVSRYLRGILPTTLVTCHFKLQMLLNVLGSYTLEINICFKLLYEFVMLDRLEPFLEKRPV